MSSELGITISAKSSAKAKKSRNRFQKLWDEAERLKNHNAALELSLNELVQRIRVDLGPIELELGRSMRKQMDKLFVFAGRKSLSLWQKDVLNGWIVSNMGTLDAMGLVDDLLCDTFSELQARELGIGIDLDAEMSATEQLDRALEEQSKVLSEQLADLTEQSVENQQDLENGYKEQPSLFDAEFEEEFDIFERDIENDFGLKSTQSIDKNPQQLFKILFHRVARALHPDKETDPVEQEHKQALMSQLLEARRQHDLITVISLYGEHVGGDLNLGEQEFRELERILIEFIDNEYQRFQQIIDQSELHSIAFSEFYNKDPARVENKIKGRIKEIKRQKKEIETFTKSVTSLQKLKPYLESRYDAMFRYF